MGIQEGVIEYTIHYVESPTDDFRANHMPGRMTVKFKDNTSLSRIEGFFGFFHISNLSNLKKKMNTTLLRLSDKKFKYAGQPEEITCGFDRMEDMRIEYTDDTRMICGYTCRKAKVYFTNPSLPGFDIYFTDQISIRDPNSANPYREINGVLLDFHLKMKNIVMHLEATSVRSEIIRDKDLSVPKEYRSISREDMERIINALLE